MFFSFTYKKIGNAVKYIFTLFILCFAIGCANKELEQLAIETMENARLSISAAETVGARDVAVPQMNSAEEMLINSETSLQSGDVERAYRLGLRAYLHARIATEKSLVIRLESQRNEVSAELELREKATEETRGRLEKLKTERATLKD